MVLVAAIVMAAEAKVLITFRNVDVVIANLKVLTNKSFFSKYVFRPLKDLPKMSKKIFFPKKDLEKRL